MVLLYLTFFYPFRFLSLYGGHWPLPDYQTFHYPGIPSVLVPYEQTNDFYFSGHTGLCTVLLFMFILHYNDDEDYKSSDETTLDSESVVTQTTQDNLLPQETSQNENKKMSLGHKLAIAYGTFTLVLTLYMLTITRGHYFNDLLIGFIVALTGIYYAGKYRYNIFYMVIWVYSRLFDVLICSRYTHKDKKTENLVSNTNKESKIENL